MSLEFDLYRLNGDPIELPPFAPLVSREEDAKTYLPSPELMAAVNVALALGRPLLLTGAPGTGKTMLAWHIVQRFQDLAGPYVFNTQTISVKRDLFYRYDALGHFRWAQRGDTDEDFGRFFHYEGLGKAIKEAQEKGTRSVVLIDEIDKAPRDFPNDLLAAIEDLEFDVPEYPGQKPTYKCPESLRPIIVITSNSEKNLPEPFLRRVVYHHIEFPDEQKLLEILKAKKIAFTKDDDSKAIVKHFNDIRSKGLNKEPATAELIAWAALLPRLGFDTKKLNTLDKLTDEDRQKLHISYAVLVKTEEDLKKLRSQ